MHAGRKKNVPADIIIVGFAGYLLNRDAEKQKAEVGVGPLRGGLECQVAGAVNLDVVSESRLHYELIYGLVIQGACPSNSALVHQLDITPAELEELLRSLAEIHGVVLHPHVCEPWIIHPFLLTPTINWIEGKQHGWWAPCVWCALGVAVLTGGEVRLHTR